MRGLLVVVGLVGVSLVASTASAERRGRLASTTPSCQRAANQLAGMLGAAPAVRAALARRCGKDRWSRDTQLCFGLASSPADASRCLGKLTKVQRRSFDGEADRLGDPRLSRWLFRRTLIVATPAVTLAAPIVLASHDTTADRGKARRLHTQGLSAYQAGRYDFAARKFAAALDAAPSPELLYHVAQAYRLTGERAKALEHYERYLEVAPRGPAANACRAQVERLRDALP